MSEVDRLSNSGLYPALPIADKRSSREGSGAPPRSDRQSPEKIPPPPADDTESAGSPRPPKSLIDEYA
jgi:hypothetical protein